MGLESVQVLRSLGGLKLKGRQKFQGNDDIVHLLGRMDVSLGEKFSFVFRLTLSYVRYKNLTVSMLWFPLFCFRYSSLPVLSWSVPSYINCIRDFLLNSKFSISKNGGSRGVQRVSSIFFWGECSGRPLPLFVGKTLCGSCKTKGIISQRSCLRLNGLGLTEP